MATYLVLNGLVVLLVATAFWRFGRGLALRPIITAFAVLFILTLIFDNLIIMADIVAYAPDRISGWYVYKAPIEDFAYIVGAVMLVPLLWRRNES